MEDWQVEEFERYLETRINTIDELLKKLPKGSNTNTFFQNKKDLLTEVLEKFKEIELEGE